jgi:hypothetical protein
VNYKSNKSAAVWEEKEAAAARAGRERRTPTGARRTKGLSAESDQHR